MSFEGLDTVVVYDELACEGELSVRWQRDDSGADGHELAARLASTNLRILQAAIVLDEHVTSDKLDDKSPASADLVRIDLKINLLLELVGKLVAANRPRPAPTRVRFNALGATWFASPPFPQPGDRGIVEIHLEECLFEPLRFAAFVTELWENGEITVKFYPVGDPVAELLGKLAFRHHRRRVAGARQPRRNESS